MTKAEFYAEVTTIGELIDFCYLYEFQDVIDGITSADDFDEWVWNTLEDVRSHTYWYELKDWMRNLEGPASDYFRITGTLEYDDIFPEDLDGLMEAVIELGDNCDFWDEEEECDPLFEEEEDSEESDSDVCWDVSVDLSVLIGVG